MTRSRLILSSLFALALITAGCLGPLSTCFYVKTVQISADRDANNFSATSVDLVVAFDEDTLKKVLSLSAAQYYEQARQLKCDHPGQLDTFHWEVVPGQVLMTEEIEFKKSCPTGGVVFARYISEGDHRIRVGKDRNIAIHLKKDDFDLNPADGEITGPIQQCMN